MSNFERAANSWYQQPPGSWLTELERSQLAYVFAKCHGDFLMQIGGARDLLHCIDLPVKHHVHLVTESILSACPHIQADVSELPIQPDSVDVILLAHVLEFAKSPVRLLKDIYQLLSPGGQLIILGFNPWSYWGLYKLFKRNGEWPWGGKFWSRAQVKQWLRACDCSIRVNKTLCFRSPCGTPHNRQLTLFIETLGQICAPAIGGVYLIVARKKVCQPIREKKQALWWKKHTIVRGVIEPTGFGMRDEKHSG